MRLGIHLYFTSELIQLNIIEYLYQSVPTHWFPSVSFKPLLNYLECRHFNAIVMVVVCDSVYNVTILVLQQKESKFPVVLAYS